jgi:long-chain fatty acid transport protein
VAFGVKHDLCPHRRISADVIWYDWSQAFNELNMQFSSPSNLGLPPVIQNTLPLDWRDSVSLRLGYEFELDDVSIWRVGYVYHASPVPNSTLNPYLDGVLEHAFSIGYSRRYHGVLLNAAYQYSFGPERHVGTSAIIGGDFDNSTFTAQAHWASLGITVPF